MSTNSATHTFHSIEEALQDLQQGKIIIVVDDEDRENEGDFVMAAEKATPEAINFMATHGRGMICAPITSQRAHELQLDYMVKGNTSSFGTPFTVTIDLIFGNSTGISTADRARTILALTKAETRPQDFMRPGHVFPLIAQDQGVLVRRGHTEAAVDLARLSGLYPAGVICEIMNEDGTMARVPSLMQMAHKYHLKIITIKDLIQYRLQNNKELTFSAPLPFPSDYGQFELYLFEEGDEQQNSHPMGAPHFALIKRPVKKLGKNQKEKPLLVRIHSECLTGDLLGSKRCDCGGQFQNSLKMINEAGEGMLIYLRQEGRGIGLSNKIKAYHLQDQGHDTISANLALGLHTDSRSYELAALVLKKFGIQSIKLMTNNPYKVEELKARGIQIVQRVPLLIQPNPWNLKYLQTKKEKMGHLLGELSQKKSPKTKTKK